MPVIKKKISFQMLPEVFSVVTIMSGLCTIYDINCKNNH
jgi:hypothetical protein